MYYMNLSWDDKRPSNAQKMTFSDRRQHHCIEFAYYTEPWVRFLNTKKT